MAWYTLADHGLVAAWYTLAGDDRYTLADFGWYTLANGAWYIIVRSLTVHYAAEKGTIHSTDSLWLYTRRKSW